MAAKEVGPSLFFSLLIITVSFLPVFVFGGEEGRLFRPLAFTKTFAMAAASIVSITIIPVLMDWFIGDRLLPVKPLGKTYQHFRHCRGHSGSGRPVCWIPAQRPFRNWNPNRWLMVSGWVIFAGFAHPQRIIHEERSPISRVLQWLYNPAFKVAIKLRWLMLLLAVLYMASALWPYRRLGSEFMPPLDDMISLHAVVRLTARSA